MKYGWLILIFLLTSLATAAQTLSGSWQGSLSAGTLQLRLVFHVHTDASGAFQSSFDSPDEGAFGIPCSETTVNGDSLLLRIKKINAGYHGKWDHGNQISGTYFQNGREFPMTLIRTTDTVAVQHRPQTPRMPFPYNSDDLEYDNASTGIHYSGTITYPKTGGPFPAVLLITGSGPQDRDETLFGHHPFAVIADYLTRRGYAVLRVDDRGTGKTTGSFMKATSLDFAADAEAGVKELMHRNDINRKKIGLIGHSEGGLVADMVGARDTSIAFIITLAGDGLKGSSLLLLQNKAYMISLGASEARAEATAALSSLLFQAALKSNDPDTRFEEAWKSISAWEKNTSPDIIANMGLTNDSVAKTFIRTQMKALSSPWMLYFLQADPAAYLSRLHCPVLALNGSKDIQVIPGPNLAAIDSVLKRTGHTRYTTVELPGLNHLFQHCKTCRVDEYGKLEESFAPEALAIMGDWLDKNVKQH